VQFYKNIAEDYLKLEEADEGISYLKKALDIEVNFYGGKHDS
jgi:hypothetical protein